MPAPFLMLLAQDTPQAKPDDEWLRRAFDWVTALFDVRMAYDAKVAIPVFLGLLVLVSIVAERVSSLVVRRLTSKTETKVDDVFFDGLPRVVRAILVFVAAWVVAQALFVEPLREGAGKLIVAGAVLTLGVLLVGMSLRMTTVWAGERDDRRGLAPGIRLVIKVAAIPLLFVSTLHALGIAITPLLTVLGVGSLAVALALQDVLRNIFAGLQLVVDQPIRAGDFVNVDDGRVRGKVLDVGLRSTRFLTVDNNIVTVPNGLLASAVIVNMDVGDPTYAHVIKVGVAYGTDSRRAQAVLLDETERAVKEVPGFVEGTAQVQFVEMADSALAFRVVVRLSRFSGLFDPVSELTHRIYARLRSEGIDIPFPTRTVVVRQDPPAAA